MRERERRDSERASGGRPTTARRISPDPINNLARLEQAVRWSPVGTSRWLHRRTVTFLQRTAGNVAVQRLLVARQGPGAAVKPGTAGGAKQRPASRPSAGIAGAPAPEPLAPDYLDMATAEAVLNKVYGTTKKVHVPEKLEVLENSQATYDKFDDIAIANRKTTPRGTLWQRGDARKFQGLLAGFADGQTFYLNKALARSSTTPHEILHLNAAAAFKSTMGKALNEGATDYLAYRALKASEIELPLLPGYDEEAALVETMARLAGGEQTLIDAYFKGGPSLASFVQAIDDKLGAGTFDRVKEAASREDFTTATSLLSGGGQAGPR